MKLSDTEREMVTQIRKQEDSLMRWRWLLLLGGILILVIDGFCVAILKRDLVTHDLESVLSVAILCPWIFISVAFGAGLIGYVERCWRGNPERRLLLRLIDDLESRDA